jgi:site-specific DNA recombinase
LGSRLEIVEAEAETIRRIYEMFTNGRTVPEMVKTLNTEQVATAKIGNVHSPWNSSRIRRVLRNTLYAGTLVWNRTKRVTDPTTGRVGSRANMPKDVQRVASPHLRVITDDVWNRAQARLARPGKGSRPTTVEDLKSTSH